jgi:hypothetical protein
MASIEYSLFRVKFVRPSQTSFLHDELTPHRIFLEALNERPSAELRSGFVWHIGNIDRFTADTGYFAIGRTTNSTIEKYDAATGNFTEEELEQSPYTHCVFDARIGLLGIAKKSGLTPTTKGIAARAQELFSRTKPVKRNQIIVEIVPIPDPEGFLKMLQHAYRVYRFTATFRGPNPFDADEYFQKPLAKYLSAAGGEKGKTEIQGDDLNRDVLEEVTRSTAATGNEASARIIRQRAQKPVTINLKGDPIKKRYAEHQHDPELVLADLLEVYERVRHDGRD